MRINNLFYFLKQGFLGVVRNAVMSSASILILASSMLVLGSFWTIWENMNNTMDNLDDLNVIFLYIDPETDDERTAQIGEEIKAMDNVVSVTFISKEENLVNELAKFPEDKRKLIESYLQINPLPDTYRIEFENLEKSAPLLFQLSMINGIDQELKDQGINPKSVVKVAEQVETFKKGIAMICMWLLVILLVVSFFVIMNTIKLTVFSRRHEIVIMRYVGATSAFIVAPFIVEGIIIGILSAAIAYGVQYYLYNYVMQNMLLNIGNTVLMPFDHFSKIIIIAFTALGLFAGVISSTMSMRKYLKA